MAQTLSTKEILEIEQARGILSAKELSDKYKISLGRIYRIWRKNKQILKKDRAIPRIENIEIDSLFVQAPKTEEYKSDEVELPQTGSPNSGEYKTILMILLGIVLVLFIQKEIMPDKDKEIMSDKDKEIMPDKDKEVMSDKDKEVMSDKDKEVMADHEEERKKMLIEMMGTRKIDPLKKPKISHMDGSGVTIYGSHPKKQDFIYSRS